MAPCPLAGRLGSLVFVFSIQPLCGAGKTVHCRAYPQLHNEVNPQNGAVDETRTRDLNLGKVALYQLSYYRVWCLGPESNQRHVDFQSTALPTELPRQDGDPEGARTLDLQRDRLAF